MAAGFAGFDEGVERGPRNSTDGPIQFQRLPVCTLFLAANDAALRIVLLDSLLDLLEIHEN